MPTDKNARILYVQKLLLEQTDIEHFLTVQQIINELEKQGISAHRKTVISDIEQLVDFGMDIVCVKSTQNRYYVRSSLFSLSEIKLLVDAVEASQFITQSKSAELIGKLSDLTSVNNADKLCRQIYLTRRMKCDNEEIYEVVDRCHEAISGCKQVTFLYYEYDGQKNRVLRNNGERYQFSPYGMTWEDGSRDLKREYIIALASHFNVSTDYLLGLSDVQSVNEDLKVACKATGLSEKAATHISTLNAITALVKIVHEGIKTGDSNINQEAREKNRNAALKARSILNKIGIESKDFKDYLPSCSSVASPIEMFNEFCENGFFDRICMLVSVFAEKVEGGEVDDKRRVTDYSDNDFFIWQFEKLVSDEFKRVIDKVQEVAQNNGNNRPKEE